MSYLVGITGGIGSGKTTVSNIFSHLGFKVYNSDERAKYLMQTNDKIIRKITWSWGVVPPMFQELPPSSEYIIWE